MEYDKKTRLVQNFVKEVRDPKKYNLHHYLQRKEDQWSKKQKSLLIDSIFRSYPFDAIRAAVEDGVRQVFDGIQRSTTLAEYVEGKFALSKDNLPVLINNIPYETAGKKFNELDPVLQDKILNWEVTIYVFTDATDDDIREMFLRQNNGKPLTATQKRTAIEPKAVTEQVFGIANHPFFKKAMTQNQLNKDFDKDVIRETLMLLNTNDEHSFLSFNQDALNKFVVWYGDNLSEELGSEIVDTLDMLDERLEKTKYLYLSLPMILYAAVKCRREGKDFDKFVEKIKEFSSTYKDNESYRSLLNGGTRSLQSVTSRYNYWNNIVENL